MIRPNLINIVTVAVIAVLGYVVIVGGARAMGLNIPYVTA